MLHLSATRAKTWIMVQVFASQLGGRGHYFVLFFVARFTSAILSLAFISVFSFAPNKNARERPLFVILIVSSTPHVCHPLPLPMLWVLSQLPRIYPSGTRTMTYLLAIKTSKARWPRHAVSIHISQLFDWLICSCTPGKCLIG